MGFLGLGVLLVVRSAVGLSIQSSTASQRAYAWLLRHTESPDAAGMKDLKSSDPNAYAIVEALLTKRSLGLLQPDQPSASFSGSAHPHSFKEEASAKGLIGPARSHAALAELPYPSVGSDGKDPFSFRPSHDDDIIASSGQKDSPAKAADGADGLMPNQVGPMQISLDWGKPPLHKARPAEVMPNNIVHQSQAKARAAAGSLLVKQTQWTDSALSADAGLLGTEMIVQEENSDHDVTSKQHHLPIVAPSINWGNPHAGLEDNLPPTQTQVVMGQQNSHITGWNTERAADISKLEQVSFGKLAQTFHHFTNVQEAHSNTSPSTAPFAAPALAAPGYAKKLAAARSNQWKFELESTDWGKSHTKAGKDHHDSPRTLAAMAQEDLDLDDDGKHAADKGPGKVLSQFLHLDESKPIVTMTQQKVEVDKDLQEEQKRAKFKRWLEKGHKKSPPVNTGNPYLLDLKGVVPPNLNLLAPMKNVMIQEDGAEKQKDDEDDDAGKLKHWLDAGKKKTVAKVNPYLMDLRSV